jgi:hypothetical protein
VSDISLGPGLGGFVGGLLTLAAGAVLLMIGLVVGIVTRLQPGERRSIRILRRCAGALVCLAVGALFLGLAPTCGSEALRRLDDWTLDIPIIGVSLGLATIIALATARRAVSSSVAPTTVARGAAAAAAVSIAIELAVYAMEGVADRTGPGPLLMSLGLAVGSAVVVIGAASLSLSRSRRDRV